MRQLDAISLQLIWNRLIAIVEEQAQVLMRGAFSTPTREAGDLSAGVFDRQGRMLAQSVTGTPGHVNSMAGSVLHFMDKYPIDTMQAGDVYLTNDPWKGTGHLFDFVIVTPVLRDDAAIGLFACTTHMVDIGGGTDMKAGDVHNEGLYLPLIRLARGGEIDPMILDIIRANSRTPTLIEGDLRSLVSANERGATRLLELMAEFELSSLAEPADYIINTSLKGMQKLIGELPNGTCKNTLRIDGVMEPIDLVATMTVKDDSIEVDFSGSSPQCPLSINVPMSYTDAYTAYGVRCIVGPDIPNNSGSLAAVKVTAPEGCILNAPYPAPVNLRHIIGQMLPDTVFGCLHQILPDKVPAEGTSALWNIILAGQWQSGAPYRVLSFHAGGAGARPNSDGLSATAFPSGVGNMPVEVTESISPVVFWRKELRPDSGGDGKWRGGHGQIIELSNREGQGFQMFTTYERMVNPALGREGGAAGATGKVYKSNGEALPPIGLSAIEGDSRVILEFPGGGGFGRPEERDPQARADEQTSGLVSGD
jgi:N-methylhydantoinase B